MQSMPYYPNYPQAPPQYAPTGSPAGVMATGPPMLGHPMPHHDPMGQPAKRKQVKNACTNCQKACKKCDDARPCPRCVKYGIADSCVNSVRKERKKGIKRGPYKRRQKSESDKAQAKREDQGPYGNAMRAPPIPYGFPSNLNQYGQPAYDYNAAQYYKDQMVGGSQYNVVNPMYPQMGYPVLMQGQNETSSPGNHQQQQQQQPHAGAYQQQPHSSLPQHYGNMVQHQQQPQQQPAYQQNQSASPQQAHASPQLYNPQQQQTTLSAPQSVSSAQHSPDIKPGGLTPMPSASTSSGTTASTPPPGSAMGEEDKSKYPGLTQLCTAALHQEPSSGGQDQSAAQESAQQQ